LSRRSCVTIPGVVRLWWSESLVPELGDGVKPDHLVVIDTGDASAWILVEVDESTERPPVIRERPWPAAEARQSAGP